MKNKLTIIFTAILLSLSPFSSHTAQATAAYNTNSIEPDEYYITVRKIMLCRSKPTTPTTETAMDLSDAVTIYDNPAGSRVLVRNGVSSPISGTATRPPDGTYTYAYVELAPTIEITAHKVFTEPGYKDGATGTTAYTAYWTTKSEHFAWSGSRPVPGHSNTNTDISARGVATIKMNTFDGGYTGDPFGVNDGKKNSPSISQGALDAYLLTGDNKLGSGSVDSYGTIAKLVGIYDIPDVAVTSSTSTLDLSFQVSKGCTLSVEETSKIFDTFSGGPFVIAVSVQ